MGLAVKHGGHCYNESHRISCKTTPPLIRSLLRDSVNSLLMSVLRLSVVMVDNELPQSTHCPPS